MTSLGRTLRATALAIVDLLAFVRERRRRLAALVTIGVLAWTPAAGPARGPDGGSARGPCSRPASGCGPSVSLTISVYVARRLVVVTGGRRVAVADPS